MNAIGGASKFTVLAVELRKLKRSRILVLSVALSFAVVVVAAMNLASAKTVEAFHTDPATAWAGYSIGYVFALALLTPLQLALLVSRLADVEHLGGGWRFNAVLGVRPDHLLRIKCVVMAGVVAALKLVELFIVVLLARLVGGVANPELGRLLLSGCGLAGTSIALGAVLLWIACSVDSQLVVLGIGVIGGFLGIAAMLSPVWLALVNPFGYFAALTPYTFGEDGVQPVQQQWMFWLLFVCVCAGVFVAGSRAFRRKEL